MRFAIMVAAVALLGSWNGPAAGQYVYFSEAAGSCGPDGIDGWKFHSTYYVFVHAPGVRNTTGVRFRLELLAWGPEDIASVEPAPGVVIEEGDPLTGMTLSWPAMEPTHEPALVLTFVDLPPTQVPDGPLAWTRDVTLYLSGDEALALDDNWTIPTHCSYTRVFWNRPDTADVVIGRTSAVEVAGVVSGPGYGGSYLEAADEQGWVQSVSPGFILATCGGCPWDWTTNEVSVEVPEETDQGTLSLLTVQPESFSVQPAAVWLRAVKPIGVRRTTFGGIKALYHGE
jgi:hypothetical protein